MLRNYEGAPPIGLTIISPVPGPRCGATGCMRDDIASILLELGLHPATLHVSGRVLLWVAGVLAGLGFILYGA